MRALRRLFGLLALAAVAVVAAVFVRRRTAVASERVDLYYADGSMTSLAKGTPEAERLLGFARDAVAAVQRA
jgi:hypothetical protein